MRDQLSRGYLKKIRSHQGRHMKQSAKKKKIGKLFILTFPGDRRPFFLGFSFWLGRRANSRVDGHDFEMGCPKSPIRCDGQVITKCNKLCLAEVAHGERHCKISFISEGSISAASKASHRRWMVALRPMCCFHFTSPSMTCECRLPGCCTLHLYRSLWSSPR